MTIPKIIHQFFAVGWESVPLEAKDAIHDMRQKNPNWEYRFYDADAAETFILNHFGARMLSVYRSIDPTYVAARADLFRYLVCYEEGGLYLDIKSTARTPLGMVFGSDDRFVLSQWFTESDKVNKHQAHPELAHIRGGEYVQWFLACEAGHPYLSKVIERVLCNIESYRPLRDGVGRMGVLRLTGPIAYTLAIHPVLEKHPHVFRDYRTELGLVYSVYGDIRTHRTKLGPHYTTQTRPIVRTTMLVTVFITAWFGTVIRTRKWVVWKIKGLMKRCSARFCNLR